MEVWMEVWMGGLMEVWMEVCHRLEFDLCGGMARMRRARGRKRKTEGR